MTGQPTGVVGAGMETGPGDERVVGAGMARDTGRDGGRPGGRLGWGGVVVAGGGVGVKGGGCVTGCQRRG